MEKSRRILSEVIDLMCILFIVTILSTFLHQSDFICVIVFLTFIIVKDVIACGRSLGKRICSLSIYFKSGEIVVKSGKLILRNLLALLSFPVSIITILIINQSIGDICCDTVVLKEFHPDFVVIKNRMIKRMITIVVFLFSIFFVSTYGSHFEVLINYEIFLPFPIQIKEVYRYDYRKGNDFIIWKYDKISFSITRSKNVFKKGNSEDLELLLLTYYQDLNDKQKELFDDYVDMTNLIDSHNYYFYKQSSLDCYILLVLVPTENKLYLFHCVN